MTSPSHVVLVHGLGRSKHDMFLLAPRLAKALPGSRICSFDYHSRNLSLQEATERLREFVLRSTKGEPVSFVGHSLGGLIVRSLDASGECSKQLHRLVTLGSPHNGAAIAQLLSRYKIPRAIFGPILTELGQLSLHPTPRQLEIGCIIGGTGNRFGFVPFFGEDNDGLVLAREAHLANCTAHIRVPVFHGLMPFSKRIADCATTFLATGSFCQGDAYIRPIPSKQ